MVLIENQAYDRDSNEFPQIYMNSINAESEVPISTQVNNKLQHLWNVNFNGIPTSSYFDFCPYTQQFRIRRATERITKDLTDHSSMKSKDSYNGIVLVWDIDDITMLSSDHFAELQILCPEIDLKPLSTLPNRVLSKSSFTNVIAQERRFVQNIEDVLSGENEDFKKYMEKYEQLKQVYNQITCDRNQVGPLNCHGLLESLQLTDSEEEINEAVMNHQKIFHDRWRYTKKCIELVNKRASKSLTKTYRNVVISRHGVAHGAAQLLVAGLSSSIPIDHIYSVHLKSKYQIFKKMQQKFGEKCCYIYVSSIDHPDYSSFNREMNKWPIYANESLFELYNFLKKYILKSSTLEPRRLESYVPYLVPR